MTLWYHGTTQESSETILDTGFNYSHNWFAKEIKHAIGMGGPVVLSVDFEDDLLPKGEHGEDVFQMCVEENILPNRVNVVDREKAIDVVAFGNAVPQVYHVTVSVGRE